MKKRYLLSLPVMMVVLFFLVDFGGFGGGGEVDSFVKDSGEISVYFCPRDDCEGILIDFIGSAEESLDCALFDIGLESLQEKLLEKENSGVLVRVVTDDGYLKKFNYSFVKADKWGLMHNKFCVVDKNKLFTGSMNPTDNGVGKNNNNLLLIESRVLSSNYLDEFEEMWNGTFKKGERVLNPKVNIDGVLVKNYFCPDDGCASRVKEELEKAEESIYFMTFSFTHEGIANILLLKNLEGVLIKGVMEARQVTKYSVFEVLKYQIGEVLKDGNKQNMHHKVFIIDEKVVVTGSFNPTGGGNSRNDENVLVIYDEGIASRFLEEFGRVRKEAVS